jgi:type II secretory pathway pseudopilin PulG
MSSRHGFTLVEAVVATSILAFGILGVIGGISLSTRTATAAMRQVEAAELAANQLELAIAAFSGAAQGLSGRQEPYRWRVDFQVKERELFLAEAAVEWDQLDRTEVLQLRRLFIWSENQR